MQHEASLLLEDRISIAASILDKKGKTSPETVFRLAFAMQSQSGSLLSYSAVVHVQEDDPNIDTTPSKLPQADVQTTAVAHAKRVSVSSIGSPRVHFQTTTATVVLTSPPTPPRTPRGVVWVDRICSALESMTRENTQASFVLTKGLQIGIRNCLEAPSQPLLVCDRRMTMQDLFGGDKIQKRPLKFRMFLALRLASNLLQLYQTQWLQNAWSKSNISFPLRTGPNGDGVADLDQPLISLVFDDDFPSTPPPKPPDLKLVLLELGILLLELWHQESFESRCSTDIVPTGYYQRLAVAMEWLDDTTDPMPEQYERAASLCIRGMIGGTSHFDNGDDSFWGAVCEDIIEPLQKNCKPWQRSQ